MYKVYDNDLFLFSCDDSAEADLYIDQGFKVVKES